MDEFGQSGDERKMIMRQSLTALIDKKIYSYPSKNGMFRPGICYPEYPFSDKTISEESNEVYDGVRLAFHYLHLDDKHWNTKEWNPLGNMVRSDGCVLIKPNLVMESNHIAENGTDCLYTHPCVVAAVIDYVIIANAGKGKIIVGDAPMQECKWDVLIHESGYKSLIDWYKSQDIDIELIDFRELSSNVVNGLHVQSVHKNAKGHVVELGEDSEFAELNRSDYKKIRVTNYDPSILPEHHNEKVHEYYVSDYVLNADVIINMPKPKTHRKGGVTISLKNFVGINVRKEYLPHHTMGAKSEGGDEYLQASFIQRTRSMLYDKRNFLSAHNKFFRAHLCHALSGLCTGLLGARGSYYQEGSWYGNETISKTITDLNKIVRYADKNGKMNSSPQREIFIVADMIVCGEKEGPVAPSEKKVGCVAAGFNPVCFDEMISALMGFDINKIPTLKAVRHSKKKFAIVESEEEAYLVSNVSKYNGKTTREIKRGDSFAFEPTSGWRGHIEQEES